MPGSWSRRFLGWFFDFSGIPSVCDDLKLQDRHSQSVQPAHQPDDPRLIGVHLEYGDIFDLPGLINDDLRRTFEALQPLHIDSTPHLDPVECR